MNRLTDIYNAISVLHQVPVGGEDLTCYAGSPRLIRAAGTEPFETVANGQTLVEHPGPGEVVWCDNAGVTCRRWNWRQGRRTQLTPHTMAALFILDALSPMTDDDLAAAWPPSEDVPSSVELRWRPLVTIRPPADPHSGLLG